MKRHKADYVLYAVCALLAIFYTGVLVWGQNPQVGIEYRMYYITHELTDWPGYGNLSYTYGTVEYCREYTNRDGSDVDYCVCSRKGKGWQTEGRYEGTQNTASESYVYYIPDEESDKAELVVDITGFEAEDDGASVTVYAGDICIGSISAEGKYCFTLGEVQADELLTVKFESDGVTFTLDWICIQ